MQQTTIWTKPLKHHKFQYIIQIYNNQIPYTTLYNWIIWAFPMTYVFLYISLFITFMHIWRKCRCCWCERPPKLIEVMKPFSSNTLYHYYEIFNMKFTFNECITNVWQWEFSNSVIFRLCREVTCLDTPITHICIKVYICTRINTTYNYEDT